ncbi:Vacuolar protein sorting-associated protein 4 [Psilocybe cubensis]|nr:Vacuolar protein sorting-associated protein 4 [Psilocybe cubensis]KAH9476233.1 Vacuolar protein sorting-associated protein 4 [Psilocybe cubensis]
MELLVLMGNPAFYNRSSDKQMAVIGATNAPWLISRPILRRFLNRRYCPLPSVDARKRILEIGLGDKVPSDLSPVDYDTLALMTNGHTGATISRLIKQALAQASERHASSIHFKTTNVSAEDSDLVECMPCFPDNSGVSGVSGPQIRQLDAVVLPPVTLTDFLIVLNDADVGEKIPEFDTEKYEQWKV